MAINRRMFKLHWGDPNSPTEIRSWTGAFDAATSGDKASWKHCFTGRRVKRWFGVSYKAKIFLGACIFSSSFNYKTFEPPKFGPRSKTCSQELHTQVNACEDTSDV